MLSHGLDEIMHFLDKDGDSQVTLEEYAKLYQQQPVASQHTQEPAAARRNQASMPDMVYAPGVAIECNRQEPPVSVWELTGVVYAAGEDDESGRYDHMRDSSNPRRESHDHDPPRYDSSNYNSARDEYHNDRPPARESYNHNHPRRDSYHDPARDHYSHDPPTRDSYHREPPSRRSYGHTPPTHKPGYQEVSSKQHSKPAYNRQTQLHSVSVASSNQHGASLPLCRVCTLPTALRTGTMLSFMP